MSKTKAIRPDIPLALASDALAGLCQALEEDLEPTQAVTIAFKDLKAQLADHTDVCVLFNSRLVAEIERAKETYRAWRDYAAKLEATHEAFKGSVKAIIESNGTLPYNGQLGKISVQGSPAKVVTQFAETDLDQTIVELFGIDSKYVRVKTTYTLNNQALKEDLGNGIEIPWARLERGTHVRFRESPVAKAKNVTPELKGAVNE